MMLVQSKSKLIQHKDSDLLTKSWLAGTNSKDLGKLFKYSDINTLNIKKVCEWISAFIRKNCEAEIIDCELTVSLKFRNLSYLYFGTIRILHYQVKLLFDETESFISRAIIRANKLKRLSENTYNGKKCRRVQESREIVFKDFEGLYELATSAEPIEDNEAFCNLNINANLLCHTIIEEVNIDQGKTGIDDTDFDFGTVTEKPEILCDFIDWQDFGAINVLNNDHTTTLTTAQKNGPPTPAGCHIGSPSATVSHRRLRNSHARGKYISPKVSNGRKLSSVLNNVRKRNRSNRKLIVDDFTKLTDHELQREWDQYKSKCFSSPRAIRIDKNKITKTHGSFLGFKFSSSILFSGSKKRKRSYFASSNKYLDVINEIFGYTSDGGLNPEIRAIEEVFRNEWEGNNHDQNFYENNGFPSMTSENQHISMESRNVINFTTTRLANAFKHSKYEFIDVKDFIESAISRKNAALIFYALLELSKEKYITIKKSASTCLIEKIYPLDLREEFKFET